MLYMFLAEGFEEVEAIAALDVIRRGGIDISTVGIGNKMITGSHGITVECDLNENGVSFDNLEGIILPGGMPGTLNLLSSDTVNRYIDYCSDNNLYICAICAAPMILGRKNLLQNKNAVCFPGFEDELIGAHLSDEYVCQDGAIITAKGMGSAVKFGLKIVSSIKGNEVAVELEKTLQCS